MATPQAFQFFDSMAKCKRRFWNSCAYRESYCRLHIFLWDSFGYLHRGLFRRKGGITPGTPYCQTGQTDLMNIFLVLVRKFGIQVNYYGQLCTFHELFIVFSVCSHIIISFLEFGEQKSLEMFLRRVFTAVREVLNKWRMNHSQNFRLFLLLKIQEYIYCERTLLCV